MRVYTPTYPNRRHNNMTNFTELKRGGSGGLCSALCTKRGGEDERSHLIGAAA